MSKQMGEYAKSINWCERERVDIHTGKKCHVIDIQREMMTIIVMVRWKFCSIKVDWPVYGVCVLPPRHRCQWYELLIWADMEGEVYDEFYLMNLRQERKSSIFHDCCDSFFIWFDPFSNFFPIFETNYSIFHMFCSIFQIFLSISTPFLMFSDPFSIHRISEVSFSGRSQ